MTKPCDHRWNKHGRCSCGAQQCGEAIHWTRGGVPCANPKPCPAHAGPLTTTAKVALALLAVLVLI